MLEKTDTQLMQQNLQRMIRNENYFSCLFEKNKQEQEPVNPFRKRMFDKNLRRSAVSCGHYNSTSNHTQSRQDESSHVNSSRISMKAVVEANNAKKIKTTKQNIITQSPLLMIERTQKMTLAESRQNMDPNKQKITQIINNFRHELDYLQQKLHAKIDIIQEKFTQQNSQRKQWEKQEEVNFMIESLQKIVGFMIENCVNLEDAVMYGSEAMDITQQKENHQRKSHTMMIKRERYPIYDQNEQEIEDQQDQNQQQQEKYEQTRQNISFGQLQNYPYSGQNNCDIKNGKRTKRSCDPKNKGKENISHQINYTNMPNTFFVNNKLHTSNEKSRHHQINKKGQHPTQNQTVRSNQQLIKSSHNRNSSHYLNNHKDIHNHPNKQNLTNNNSYQYSSCPIQIKQNQQLVKSIYETVLEQRQMRIKMKKKLI